MSRPRHRIDVLPADSGQWIASCSCLWKGKEKRKRFATAQRDAAKHLKEMKKRRASLARAIRQMNKDKTQ